MRSIDRRILAWSALALAPTSLVLSDCLAPTEVTLDISTDVDCKARHPNTGIASAPAGTVWDAQENATETDTCDAGEVGTVVLVPGESKSFAVRVVGAIGYSARECATGKPEPGHGDPHKPDPAHPGWGCITATRSLGFVPHRPLKLPIRLYANCIGKACESGTTCDATGLCVSDAVGDCSVTGTCEEPATSGASGSGGASASSGGATSSSSGPGGCGDTSNNRLNCGACGHDCEKGDCLAGVCQPFVLATISSASLGGIVVDSKDCYVAALFGGAPEIDGVYKMSKSAPGGAKQLFALPAARDLSVSSTLLQVTDGSIVVDCVTGMVSCGPVGAAWTSVAVSGDPLAASYGFSDANGQISVVNGSGMLKQVISGARDLAVLGNEVLVAGATGAHYFADAQSMPVVWGPGPATYVALSKKGGFGIFGNTIQWSPNNDTVLKKVADKQVGATNLAASPSGGLAWLAIPASGLGRDVRYATTTSAGSTRIGHVAVFADLALDDNAAYWTENNDGTIVKVVLP